jgi:opacity protein-like surface antigen
MKRTSFTLTTIALALVSVTSQAAETYFTGPSIALGVSRIENQTSLQGQGYLEDLANGVGAKSDFSNLRSKGTALTAELSYGFPLGEHIVTSVGFTYDFGKQNASNRTLVSNTGTNANMNMSMTHHNSVYIAPGVRIGKQWLAYSKIGYHQVKANYAANYTSPPLSGKISGSNVHKGMGYGLGVAVAANENVEVRMEVEKIKYSKLSTEFLDATPKSTRASLLVGYRF